MTADHEPGVDTELLELLAHEVGVEADRRRIAQAAHEATLSHPGPPDETWEPRLKQAAADVGLHTHAAPFSATAAVAQAAASAPLVGFGPGGWLALVARKGGRARLRSAGGGDEWVGPAGLARRVGATDAYAARVWAFVHPAAPCTPAGDGHAHDAGGHHGHRPPLWWLVRLLRPERRDIAAVVVFGLFIGLLSLMVPLAAEELVASVGRGVLYQPIVVLSLALGACLALAAAMRALQAWVVEFMQQRLFVRVVADLAYRLPRVTQQAFDAQHGPELVNRFFDVLTLQKTVATLLLDGVMVVVTALAGTAVLVVYDPVLMGTFAAVVLGAVLFILFVLGRRAVATSVAESVAKYDVAFWLQELVHHPRAFKLAGGPDLAWAEADRLAREYVLARRAHFRILFRQVASMLALQVLAGTALLGIGGFLVVERRITLGQLVAAELIVTVVLASLTKFGKSLEAYYDLMAAVDKLGLLLDLPLERAGGEALPATAAGAAVAFDGVGYAYPGGRLVLTKVTGRIEAGERVAVLGGSGAGKSTLVELLAGLRSPTEGRIELDGIDLRELRLESLREQVAVVQGAEIFDGTVMDNVLLGRTQYGPADVRRALEQVGLLDDVRALPDGLNTYLLTGGLSLSIGQAERLVLARALLGRPRLLVLDEVLDDFDATTRLQLSPLLFDRAAPWTLLLISRRPELIDQCDRAVTIGRAQAGGPSTVVPTTPAGRMLAGAAN